MGQAWEAATASVPCVLVVCTANVCRSPVAARLVADALGSRMQVISAGVRATPGMSACPQAQEWLAKQYAGARRGRHGSPVWVPDDGHAARQLDVDLVAASALILTATREHRGAVVQLLPAAQLRTFTLAQAGRIAAWQVGKGVRAPGARADDPAARVHWLREQLDAGRGQAPLPSSESADDVPDPHENEVSHQAALREVRVAVRALAELVQ